MYTSPITYAAEQETQGPVVRKVGSFCRYRKALYFWSLGISLYLELFCFLSFITIVLRNLCSGTHRRNRKVDGPSLDKSLFADDFKI